MMKFWTSAALLAAMLLVAGCDKAPEAKPTGKGAKAKPDAKPEVANVDDHSGWWCDEHGLREEVCSMCSAKAAKAFQAKGDWCKEHKRAKSQCFLCDPKLEAKFAEEYIAKFGKRPPEPDGQREEKK